MPHCSKLLYNNVLWANWGPALKHVVIVGNGFSSYQQRLPSRQLNSEVMYIAKILPHLQEVNIPNTFYLKDIFNDSSIHFFHEHVLSKIEKDFWNPRPEPAYDVNDPEIVTIAKQR
ncbi:SRR1-like protein [Actinia tenebrosa]|uniref:SRR1-like protein n=1 Tax=Actinia tenebrosa TaxID=6105 RepID=A0A6P8HDX5_ACTTE|nr:SRR1-like protein [Actinia tenebrosa]